MTPSETAQRLIDLIRQPSVTPEASGALDVVQAWLEPAGFSCHRLHFPAVGPDQVDNLFARFGTGSPHFAFAGHVDVVPAGDVSAWTTPPFAGTLSNGTITGRGAQDMKGGIAAFSTAALGFLHDTPGFDGSISLIITGDEEGPAIDGTVKMLGWMEANSHLPSHCLVGEPTCVETLGDTIKIGRRGSLNGVLVARGRQGHAAYPHRAANPVPALLKILTAFGQVLDTGTEHFAPSNLEITSVDVGNPAFNVIPAQARAQFNVRFNDNYSAASLEAWLRQQMACVDDPAIEVTLETSSNAESFITPPGRFTKQVSAAVQASTGTRPELSTGGGTSDARFITRYCPVVEFGPVGNTMHQIDEQIRVAELDRLTKVYREILARYFE
ncbi:MAG: succinyl-diaminopimelate desuccinylase [Alphaproteobacteria bacterium]